MEHAYNLRRTGIRRARSPSHSSSSGDKVGDEKSPHALPGVAGAFGDTENHLELQIPTTQNQTLTR